MNSFAWFKEELNSLHPDLYTKKNLEADLFSGSLRDFYRTSLSSGITLILKNLGFDPGYFQLTFYESSKEGAVLDVSWSAVLYRIGITLELKKLTSYHALYLELCQQLENHMRSLLAPQFVSIKQEDNKPAQPAARMFFYVAALLENTGATKENWPLARQAYADFLSELSEKTGMLLSEFNGEDAQFLASNKKNNDPTKKGLLIIEPQTAKIRGD